MHISRKTVTGVAVLGIIVIAVSGAWVVRPHSQKPSSATQKTPANYSSQQPVTQNTQPTTTSPQSASQISAWHLTVPLGADVQSASYTISKPQIDPQGVHIQALNLYITDDAMDTDKCSVTMVGGKQVRLAHVQMIRVKKDQVLDLGRYRGTNIPNAYTDGSYVYHINYAVPDCASPAFASHIQSLVESLKQVGGAQ